MGVMYLSEEGLIKLKSDLEQLVKVERPGISRLISEARDKGDLSENAEYHAAKEAQGMLEMKISKLRESLANSRLVDKNRIDTSNVQIMNKVKIKNKAEVACMLDRTCAGEEVKCCIYIFFVLLTGNHSTILRKVGLGLSGYSGKVPHRAW